MELKFKISDNMRFKTSVGYVQPQHSGNEPYKNSKIIIQPLFGEVGKATKEEE